MVAHGDLEHRAYGVYRIPTVPFDEYTELMEAVLWANGRGTIVGESALLLWDLADVNPRKIHIAVPPPYRPRRKDGDLYRVHQIRLTDADLDETHGVPVVTPAVAIRQAIELGGKAKHTYGKREPGSNNADFRNPKQLPQNRN